VGILYILITHIEYRPARFTLRVPIDTTTDGVTADGDRRERRGAARAVAVDDGIGQVARGTPPSHRETVRT
jgi:hypothetical protein